MNYDKLKKKIKEYCEIYIDYYKITNIILNDPDIIFDDNKINQLFNNTIDNSEIDIMIKKIIFNNILASILLTDYIPGKITYNCHVAIRINAQNKMNILRLNNMVGFDASNLFKF
jgi:hypothetical protein